MGTNIDACDIFSAITPSYRTYARDWATLERACKLIETACAGLEYPKGRSYVRYCAEFADCLARFRISVEAIACGLLYRAVLDSTIKMENVRSLVGLSGQSLCDDLISVSRLDWSPFDQSNRSPQYIERQAVLRRMYLFAVGEVDETQAESQAADQSEWLHRRRQHMDNLVKMILHSVEDFRALSVKLIERALLGSMLPSRGLPYMSSSDLRSYALINLHVYGGVADRLGLWNIKSELEDGAFKLLNPLEYHNIAEQLAEQRAAREQAIAEVVKVVAEYLKQRDFEVTVTGRAKHIYSIFMKMQAKSLRFDQVNDLLGIRVITNNSEACYAVAGVLQAKWPPAEDFYDGRSMRDWIAHPKENQYRSLHTTLNIEGRLVELQIRTPEMDELAKYGASSVHWVYKREKAYREGKQARVVSEKERRWNAELIGVRRQVAQDDLVQADGGMASSSDRARLSGEIFVITPKGDIVALPQRSTALDFAYRIHTEVGHRYSGAKIGGRLAKLDEDLKNGDVVDLLPPRGRGVPSKEWLNIRRDEFGNPQYIYARNPQTRRKIRHGLRKAGIWPEK